MSYIILTGCQSAILQILNDYGLEPLEAHTLPVAKAIVEDPGDPVLNYEINEAARKASVHLVRHLSPQDS